MRARSSNSSALARHSCTVDDTTTAQPTCGLQINARGADRSHSLGPVATAGRSLAPMENTTASPGGSCRKWGLAMGCKEHGRQRPRSMASCPQPSPLRRALQCVLQIARSPIPVRRVLAQLLEPPCTDPYARWCGRGGAARLPPIPIFDPELNSRPDACSPVGLRARLTTLCLRSAAG
jgi:hypothetical protein